MPSTREKLEALRASAEERDLTPVAWWIGEQHHDQALDELADEPQVEVEAGRLVSIGSLEVKLLTETPDRFALWCREGVLDL